MTEALLSSTYFGPVQWYQKLNRFDKCLIESQESFVKQTYRNRCVIATTNGMQSLTIPIEHGESRLMRDIRISNHGHWRHLHWNALMSAYGESPFLNSMPTTFIPFSNNHGTICSTTTWPLPIKCANLSTFSLVWKSPTILQEKPNTTIARPFNPSIPYPIKGSHRVHTIKCTHRSTVSCPISASWTCFSTRDRKPFFTCRPNLTGK